MPYLLVPFLVITVALLIQGEPKARRKQVLVFKPASTLLVMAIALSSVAQPGADLAYSGAIVLGLFFSLGGDVALIYPGDRPFLLGVASFLLAHVVYGLAFGLKSGLQGPIWGYAVALLVMGGVFYALMFPYLGKMRVPVGVYALVISAMVWTALSTLHSPAFSIAQGWLLVVGAVLFYLSDVILAVARFARPFPWSRLANLSTYYGGQLLIALSTWYALGRR